MPNEYDISETEKLEKGIKDEIKKCQDEVADLTKTIEQYRKATDLKILALVAQEERIELLQKLLLALNED